MKPTATKAGTGEDSPPKTSRGAVGSADSFISNFSPPELGENKFHCVKPPRLWSLVTAAQGD